jgi:hypothetical protein
MSKPIKSVNQTIILLMFNVISLVFLVGCSTTANVVKSTANTIDSAEDEVTNVSGVKSTASAAKSKAVTPAPDTSFIKHSKRQKKRADMPFQKVWIKAGFEIKDFKKLMVAPVNTQHMLEMDWLHQASSANWAGDVKKDIRELAKYFRAQVVKEFKKDAKHRFQIVYTHRPGTPVLRMELALIQIDPSTPVLHALGMAAPVYGTGAAVSVANQRQAAFEGRLRDLRTGQIVATFADRDMADIGPLDVTKLTWYGPAKGIMDRWAKQFVQVANKKPGDVVTDPTPFTLMPF